MEAVQRAREAVEVRRGQIYEKARDLVVPGTPVWP